MVSSSRSSGRRRALVFAAAHFAFCLLLQVESYLLFVVPSGQGAADAARFFAALPFLQIEHFAASSALGLLALLVDKASTSRNRRSFRLVPHLLLGSANLYLVADQIGYRVFFDHLRPSLAEGALAAPLALADSVLEETGWATAVNLALAGALSVAVWMRLEGRDSTGEPWPRPASGWWRLPAKPLVAGWLGLSLLASWHLDNHNLEHHPLGTLLADLTAGAPSLSAGPGASPGEAPSLVELQTPIHGRALPDPKEDADLLRVRNAVRSLDRPHVLLVVLESVGSLQVFPPGSPGDRSSAAQSLDPERSPHLARRLERGVVFTSVYAPFPGTARSHAALATGGLTPTWGSVHEELPGGFAGPTLRSELAAHGYRTAAFSAGDLRFERLGALYPEDELDTVFEPGTRPAEWTEKHRIHSWGVREDAVVPHLVDWLAAGDGPGFAELLTISTHHPYGAPEEHRSPFDGDDRKSRYLRSLHYNDAVLGRLFGALERKGLLEQTIVLVTGDHGQAFGERHPGNFTHKNFLYEENVRSFLALFAPGVLPEVLDRPVLSGRVGSLGDVLPTLLDLLGAEAPDVPGRSLFPPGYGPRTVYFHKNAHPELWGLRDGRWKFIARRAGEKRYQLFDLGADPTEQRNLAHLHRDRLEEYDRRCAAWYAAQNSAYRARLRHLETPRTEPLRVDEVASFGPKRLAFGVLAGGDEGDLAVRSRFRPDERPVAWTLWTTTPEPRTVLYEWLSPSGEPLRRRLRLSPDWSRTYTLHPGELPLEEGVWRLTILDPDGEELITGEIRVDADEGG